MDLSNIIGSGAKPYLEYGWVCAPNTAGQSITANTLTTLTIDTEVADTGNFGSIASNQITLAAGTYYADLYVPTWNSAAYNTYPISIISLYNVTGSSYITRKEITNGANSPQSYIEPRILVQFTVASSVVIQARVQMSQGGQIGYNASFTSSSATDNQRTTLKLWKLA